MKSLGKLLRDARLEKNLKIREVSRKLGISAMYISELETEKKIPLDSTYLEKISIFYGLSYTKVKEAAEFTKAGIISRLDDHDSSSEGTINTKH